MRVAWLTFFVIIVINFTIGCGQANTPVSPGESLASHGSCDGFVRTAEGSPIGLKSKANFVVAENVPDDFMQPIKDAMKVWNDAIGKEIFSISGRGSIETAQSENTYSILWMTEWPDGEFDQQADTSLYVENNNITAAHIKIDAKNFRFSTNPDKESLDPESIMIHELGHVLGLKHDPSTDSVMYMSLPFGTTRTTLSSSDISDVNCQYR